MLLRIDELSRADHFHLEDTDTCFYVREYTAGDYRASSENQLVST